MPTKAPSSILLSSAKLSTPAWLQRAPPSAANRMGVARRIPLLSSSTVKTLKNPSMLATFSFQVTASPASEPIAHAHDTLLIQFPCSNKEDNESDDRASQLARDSQIQLQTQLCAQFETGKQDGDDEHPNGMYLPKDGGCKAIKTQANRETGHYSAVNAHHLDGTCQPGESAADQHCADGCIITRDTSKKGKFPGLSGHALFVARFGSP